LADFAVRHVREGRHVGGHRDGAKDVLSRNAQRRHGVRVYSYSRGQGQGSGWRQMLIAERKQPVPETAAMRVDFPVWMKTLTRRDRRIIHGLIRGERSYDPSSTVAFGESALAPSGTRFWGIS
jgi:hypothetical protein